MQKEITISITVKGFREKINIKYLNEGLIINI